MRLPLVMMTLGLVCLAAGCSEAPLASEEGAATDAPAMAACTPANTDNYGTEVNDLYIVGAETWRETNGIHALQKTETCEGPADTKLSP